MHLLQYICSLKKIQYFDLYGAILLLNLGTAVYFIIFHDGKNLNMFSLIFYCVGVLYGIKFLGNALFKKKKLISYIKKPHGLQESL